MQKYEKLEKIGEGITTKLCVFMHGFWVSFYNIHCAGKFFFISLFLTIYRNLWNRFQSKAQGNARDSSAETSETRRR